MLTNLISPNEIAELRKHGAKITSEDKPTEISGWSLLIEQLADIAKSNEIIANKKSEKLTETLEKLVKSISNSDIDMGPIITILDEIRKNTVIQHKENPSYMFTVERDQRGLLKTIIAKPVSDK